MSSISSSPTLRAHTILQGNIGAIKSRLDGVREEAVTGRASDTARALGGDIGRLQRLQQAHGYAEERTRSLDYASSRAAAAQNTLEAIRTQGSDVHIALVSGLSGNAPQALSAAETKAAGAVDDIVSRLNASFGGRALFGGDEAGTPLSSAEELLTELRTVIAGAADTATALTDLDAWFNDPAGGFATSFYQGGAGDAAEIELTHGEWAPTSVKADREELRSVLHGLSVAALAAEAPAEADRLAMMEAGSDVLRPALDRLIGLQGQLGVQEERIAKAQAAQEAEAASLATAVSALTSRDQGEAVTEMRMLESQLEAAYLTTSRMANLSLLNFLR